MLEFWVIYLDLIIKMAVQLAPNVHYLKFTTKQCAGQRKSRTSWVGPPPERGSEVFVTKLPRNVFEDVLYPLFSQVGFIFELRLMMDFSGSNRGFAFVKYANHYQALAAVTYLNNYEIQGRHIAVFISVDNCRLYMRNLPKVTKMEFLEELKSKVNGVTSLVTYKFTGDLKKMFAVVEFEDHHAAAMARRALVPGSVKLFGEIVQVEWADCRSRYGDKQVSQFSVWTQIRW